MPQAAPRLRPSPGRPTRAQAIERDRELLDKALDLFLEHGFERASIDAITAAVGMAKRTIYARYGDKRSLFRAALQRAIDEWRLPPERLIAAEVEDLEESLLAIGRVLLANILRPEGLRLLQITNAEARRMPGLGPYTSQLGTEATIAFLSNFFSRRVPGIPNEDADAAAMAFLQLVVGGPANMAALGYMLDGELVDQQTVYNVHLFLHGLLPAQDG